MQDEDREAMLTPCMTMAAAIDRHLFIILFGISHLPGRPKGREELGS